MRLTAYLLASFGAAPLTAEPLRCADPLFDVVAADHDTSLRVCGSAADARASLLSCGIEVTRPITITVVERIDSLTGSCLGIYECGDDRIEILSPRALGAARDPDGAFSGIDDGPLWNSVLVHELTHAVFDETACPFGTCVATSEYAAYAMQVRSLPADERARFEENVALKNEATRDAISAVMLFMAPDRFAAYTWRHFSSRPDPCAYMALIMQGKILFDRERPYVE